MYVLATTHTTSSFLNILHHCSTWVTEVNTFPLSPKGCGWHLGHWLQPRLGWHLSMLMLSPRIVPLRLVLHFFIPPAPWSLAISIVWPFLLHKFVFTQNAAVSYRISSLCNIFILSLKVFIIYAHTFLFLHSSLFLVLGNIPLLSTMK